MKEERLMDYNWLVKFTPQREWIRGRGLFLWLAFFFTEIGAAIYFVGLFLDSPHAWITGWIVTLIFGGLLHLAFLEKPMRSWRIFLRPGSSELSRGLWVILFFGLLGFLQIIPIILPNLPWTGENLLLKTVMGILCILLILHGYATMGIVKALPLWNTSVLYPMVLASSILIGSQAVEIIFFFSGQEIITAEIWARWSLIAYIGLLLIFIWGAYHSSENERVSVKMFLNGDSVIHFYIGVIFIGIVIPLIITFFIWKSGISRFGESLVIIRLACVIVGDLVMRYIILRCAVYSPLIQK